jgi:hypothetical protein
MAEQQYDPVIVEYVEAVAARFGAAGLEDLIELASAELETARAALAELRDTAE